MPFEDNILLRIKREYTDNEKMALLIQKVKELEFGNGILKSDLAELEHRHKLDKLIYTKSLNEANLKIASIEKDNRRYKKVYYIFKKIVSLFHLFLSDTLKPSHYVELCKIIKQKQQEYTSQYDRSRCHQEKLKT